ncbi:MAG: hypothetical protein LBT31_03230 [Synergistaceae bacterium]|jgi:phosphoglycerate dehydrogenase-like enzyme|nr:hypothetical protein [Synergistaceae bacterium]
MIKVVFPDQAIFEEYIPYLDALKPLERNAEIIAYSEAPCEKEERYERLKDADVIIFGVHKFDNEFLKRLEKLKMLQFMGVGYATFADPEFCEKSGILFMGVDNYGSNAVAEYALAQMLSLARNVVAADRYMRDGKWVYTNLEGIEISDSTVGILGAGNIGCLVAKKLRALGARVIVNDVFESEELKNEVGVEYAPIEEVFSKSDIISVHVKYLPATKNLVSEKLIKLMKKEALFINTSRSEIVDMEALTDALRSGSIKGAAIDVFDDEPLTDFSICRLPNVQTSPHIGYFSGKAKGNCLKKCVDQVVEKLPLLNIPFH